jgi:hypothetical protein
MSLPFVRRSAAALPAGFLLRLIDSDLGFLRRADRGLIRGAILSTRCLALPTGGQLLHVARALHFPFLMDPDTAVLAEVNAENARAAWLRAMPAAATIMSLPMVPSDLDDDEALQTFARAVLSTQGGAVALSAGYFRIAEPADPWREVNQRLLAATTTVAAGRPVCAWLELTLDGLRDQDLASVVAAELSGASVVILRVAGLRAAAATDEEAFAVLSAVAALRARGPQVVLDCVGTLGAAAIPAGAHAFSGGVTHHRSVPLTPVHTRPPSSRALGYEVPLQFRQLPRDAAMVAALTGDLEACGEHGCRALEPKVPKTGRTAVLRTHFIHTAEVDAQFAWYAGAASLAAELKASPERGAQAWGRALERFAAAAAASTHSPR